MRHLKRVLLFVFIFLILNTVILAATQTIKVIEKPTEQTASKSIWDYFRGWWVWAILIVIILALLTWLILWILKKLKEASDIWYKIKQDKKKMCKLHRDKHRVRAFFRTTKNCPIKIIYTNDNFIHTKVLGYYKGHYFSRDGNLTILFNFRKLWLVLPKNDLLFINLKKDMIITRKEVKEINGKKITEVINEKFDLPQNIVSFNHDEIIVNAAGIDIDYRTEVFVPVMKDKNGNLINMAVPLYESLKTIAIEGYLYDSLDDFVRVTKKSIELNPLIRGYNKVSDSSSSIETQQPTMTRQQQ